MVISWRARPTHWYMVALLAGAESVLARGRQVRSLAAEMLLFDLGARL